MEKLEKLGIFIKNDWPSIVNVEFAILRKVIGSLQMTVVRIIDHQS